MAEAISCKIIWLIFVFFWKQFQLVIRWQIGLLSILATCVKGPWVSCQYQLVEQRFLVYVKSVYLSVKCRLADDRVWGGRRSGHFSQKFSIVFIILWQFDSVLTSRGGLSILPLLRDGRFGKLSEHGRLREAHQEVVHSRVFLLAFNKVVYLFKAVEKEKKSSSQSFVPKLKQKREDTETKNIPSFWPGRKGRKLTWSTSLSPSSLSVITNSFRLANMGAK